MIRTLLLIGLTAGCIDDYERADVAEASIEVMDGTISAVALDFSGFTEQTRTSGPREGFTIDGALGQAQLTGSGSYIGDEIAVQVHGVLDKWYSSGYGIELTGTIDFTVRVTYTEQGLLEPVIEVGAGQLSANVDARWKAEGHHDLAIARCYAADSRGFSGEIDGEYTRNLVFENDPDCVRSR